MSTIPSAQLVLPSFDGRDYPEARLQFAGGEWIDAATLEEHLGANTKIGDEVELTVKAVVSAKNFRRGLRNQDGMQVDRHMLTISLQVTSIEPI